MINERNNHLTGDEESYIIPFSTQILRCFLLYPELDILALWFFLFEENKNNWLPLQL